MQERIEQIGFGGLQLIQNPQGFCFGVDAVLLADFAAQFCPQFQRAADLGSGTGIIPFVLDHKTKCGGTITGIELQQDYVDMAARSSKLNGVEDRIHFVQADVAFAEQLSLERGSVSLVTSNPPYMERGSGLTNRYTGKYIARHETSAGLEDFVRTASFLLKDKGHFCMVHRPSRLVDIFCCCRKYRLEPKHVRFVLPHRGEIPNIVLIHCVYGGGRELKFLEELCVYNSDGTYTEEIEKIYERQRT